MIINIIAILITIILIYFLIYSRGSEEERFSNIKTSNGLLCNKNTRHCTFPQCSHPCCNSILLEILENVSSILETHGIKLWLAYGSLLGLRRHKGFIPWDDDLDTMTLATADQIEKARKEIEKLGYILTRHTDNKKSNDFPPAYDYYSVEYSKTNKNHIDIALMTYIGDNILFDGPVSFKNTIINNMEKYKQWLSKVDMIFPLKQSNFYNVKVNIPNRTDDLLKYLYGDDCLKTAVVKKENSAGTLDAEIRNDITNFIAGPILKYESRSKQPNNNYGIYKCFIINLGWQHDRLHHTIEQCDKYDLWTERIDAVKGKDLKDISSIYAKKNYDMIPNEIACYLSHMRAIQQISQLPDGSKCLVLEDDIYFRDDFDSVMKNINHSLKLIDWDIVMMGNSLYNTSQIEMIAPNLAITGLGTGTWAYMITPKSAKYILENLFPISYPIDLVLTIQHKKFKTDKKYDNRFLGKLKKFCVYTGTTFPNSSRIGIIDELSTSWKASTSSSKD